MIIYDSFYVLFKEKVYQDRGRKLRKCEIALIPFIALFFLATAILYLLKDYEIYIVSHRVHLFFNILSLIAFTILYITLLLIMNSYNKKTNFIQLNDENIIENFRNLLKETKYNSKEKVKWLLSCSYKKNPYSYFNRVLSVVGKLITFFITILALFIGVILERASYSEILNLLTEFCVLLVLIIILAIGFMTIHDFFVSKKRSCLELLIQCLEYVKYDYI